MVSLTTEHRATVRRIITHRLPGRDVRIFGSRARGDAKPYSDLDLVIYDDEPVDELALAEATEDFDESALPYHVDLAQWRDLPDSLRRAIAQDNVRLSP